MKLFPKNILPEKNVKKFIVIFYSIALIGFILPFSRSVFIILTPFALLASTYLLAIYHEKYLNRDAVAFSLIFILGFFIEAVGVKTGLIFGEYSYGRALGVKLLETPLLIGVNWLFLTYAATSVSERITPSKLMQMILAPSIMLLYDLIAEQVAPHLDMWSFQSTSVPLKNYISWWIMGFLFIALLKCLKINTKNPFASILLAGQFLFFVGLLLFFLFAK
jgi:putative membrane protein